MWDNRPEEEAAEKWAEVRRSLSFYVVIFGLLFAGVLFLFWWSRMAVDFNSGSVTGTNRPTYRVFGVVRNARSGAPVPWARIEDDRAGAPPLFDTDAEVDGSYALKTLPLRHAVHVFAQGYRARTLPVGRMWYQWWPGGEERLDVALTPEEGGH